MANLPDPKGTMFFANLVSKLEDLDTHIVLLHAMQGGGTAIMGAGSNASGSSVGQGSESYDLFSILDRLAHGEIYNSPNSLTRLSGLGRSWAGLGRDLIARSMLV